MPTFVRPRDAANLKCANQPGRQLECRTTVVNWALATDVNRAPNCAARPKAEELGRILREFPAAQALKQIGWLNDSQEEQSNEIDGER